MLYVLQCFTSKLNSFRFFLAAFWNCYVIFIIIFKNFNYYWIFITSVVIFLIKYFSYMIIVIDFVILSFVVIVINIVIVNIFFFCYVTVSVYFWKKEIHWEQNIVYLLMSANCIKKFLSLDEFRLKSQNIPTSVCVDSLKLFLFFYHSLFKYITIIFVILQVRFIWMIVITSEKITSLIVFLFIMLSNNFFF